MNLPKGKLLLSALEKINIVLLGGVILAIIFVVLWAVLPLSIFIVILNGVFVGSLCSILVAYWNLITNSIVGVPPYDRVRQMTLGFFLCWVVIALTALRSIWLRSTGFDVNSFTLTAILRYIAIIAAWLQVTAPDFGLGLFHGRDRKVLAGSAIAGVTVSVLIIMAQTSEVLE